MRILHLTTFLQGSAGRAVLDLATGQQAAGHAVAVVTSKTGVNPYGNDAEQMQALKDAGVSVHAVDSLFRRDYAANLNVVRFIQQRPEAAPPDVIHAHTAVASVAGMVAASDTPSRVLQTLHRWGVRLSAVQTQSDLTVLRQLARVVARDERSRSMLIRFGLAADRVGVIPYGVRPRHARVEAVDTADADLGRVRDLRRHGRPVVCCIGTVGPSRDQRLLVDALHALPPAQRPFCLVLGGGEVGRLSLYARARGVGESIQFCGHKPDARRYLRETDCLVLPSTGGGLPLSLLEAFCERIPVVAAGGDDLRAVLHHGVTAMVFPPNDARGLAAAISATLGMTAAARDAMRDAAHEVYRARFTADTMTARYMAEYGRLLAGHSACAGRELAA